MKTYLFTYLCSCSLALLLTLCVIWFARRFKFVDVPSIRKLHSHPIARFGGIAIFISAIVSLMAFLFLNNLTGNIFREAGTKITALLGGCLLMFLVGLFDDVKGLRARYKLIAELIAAVLVCSFGIRIESIALPGIFRLDIGLVMGWLITIFWIVGITNSINIVDGLDGLAAGISAIACGTIAILAIYFGEKTIAILMLGLLGSLTGFLFFNFNPAKIFMGDCGSLFLGFAIASSSMLCSIETSSQVALALPILALGIPIFDTFFSMLRRFIERRSLFAPDRSHFHHKLLDIGLNQRHAVIISYIATLIFVGLGSFLLISENFNSVVIFACILVLIVLLFRVVGSVRLRETIEGFRARHAIDRQLKKEISHFEDMQLHFRQIKTFEDWWEIVSLAAGRMDFISLNLPVCNLDGSDHILEWKNKNVTSKKQDQVTMSIPIHDYRSNKNLDLKIKVHKNGSLESIGHKVTLFGRLLDEYSFIPKS